MARKRWSDLTARQQRLVYAGGVLEAILTAAALRDLAGRPAEQVRGPKAAWVLGMAVQPFGPLAYLLAGRR